jgi:hypothetical protein
MKIRRLIQLVIPHLVLYVVTFAFFSKCFLPNTASTLDVSPKVRHIILLGVVIIVFPLVSVIYELRASNKMAF